MPTTTLSDHDAINREYHQRATEILEDKTISEEERRKRLVVAYAVAARARELIRDKIAAERADERAKLEHRYLGVGGAYSNPAEKIALAASFRDALERAEAAAQRNADEPALTALGELGALATLIQRARAVGDTTLERAGLTVAMERGDVPALNTYLEAHPEQEPNLQRLYDLTVHVNDPTVIFREETEHGIHPVGVDPTDAARFVRVNDLATHVEAQATVTVERSLLGARAAARRL